MDGNRERRRDVRTRMREPLMASAELAGTYFPAEMVDLSESGAQFRFPECDTQLEIKEGCETCWTVCLLSGKLTRFKAEARWFHRIRNEGAIGVKFPETIRSTLFQELVRSIPMPA